MSAWPVVVVALLAVLVAIAVYLRTPAEKRHLRNSPLSAEQQLAKYPPSAQAVIIRRNPKRAFLKGIPVYVAAAVLAAYSTWLQHVPNPRCASMFGLSSSYLSLVLFTYVVPIGVLIFSLYMASVGVKTLRTGYFLPLDSAVFRDKIATKGWPSQIRGIVSVAAPVLALACLYFGNNYYTCVVHGRSASAVNTRILATCRTHGKTVGAPLRQAHLPPKPVQ